MFFRCSIDSECKWYKYKESEGKNCALINEASTAADNQIFISSSQTVIYKKGIFTVLNVVAARLCFHRRLPFCSQGVYPSMHWSRQPTGRHTLLGRHSPRVDTPWADIPQPSVCLDTHTPSPVYASIHTPPAQCMLGYTSLRRPLQRRIRILLECILVYIVSETSIEFRFFKRDHHIHCIICQNGI